MSNLQANEYGLIELTDGRKIYEEQKCIETISRLKGRLIDIDGDLIYALCEVDRLKDERLEIKEAIERWEHELELTQIETFKTKTNNLYADLTGVTLETKQETNKKKKPTTK